MHTFADTFPFPALFPAAQHLAVLQAQVDDAVAKGARVLCGGRRLAARPEGSFFEVPILFGKQTKKHIDKRRKFRSEFLR